MCHFNANCCIWNRHTWHKAVAFVQVFFMCNLNLNKQNAACYAQEIKITISLACTVLLCWMWCSAAVLFISIALELPRRESGRHTRVKQRELASGCVTCLLTLRISLQGMTRSALVIKNTKNTVLNLDLHSFTSMYNSISLQMQI